jgi:aminotransferase
LIFRNPFVGFSARIFENLSSMIPSANPENRFIAERIGKVPVSGLHRFFGIAASMPDVISLGVGEPDFPTPAPIAKAGFDAVYERSIGYTANAGLIELREMLAAHLQTHYKVVYEPKDEILITVGVSEALKCVFSAICNDGDEIIVPQPCFVAYEPEIIFAGGVPVPVICRPENDFEPAPEDIRAAVTEKTKAIFIGFPNNPTGAVLGHETALEIARIAEERDLLVISDEIYDRLVYGARHVCFPALPAMKERTVLLGGFSKDYSMTGWRVGYVCANRELTAAFSKIHQYAVMSAPTISQYAALAALEIGEPFVRQMHDEYARRRDLVVALLDEMNLECVRPKGAFYAFPSVQKTGLTGDEFAERLLMEKRVAVVPGSSFGKGGENHIRIAYCKSIEEIEEALKRMKDFIEEL